MNSDSKTGMTRWDFVYHAAREWGIFAVMTCALFWFGYLDHVHQRSQFDQTNEFVRGKLTELVANSIAANEKLVDKIEENQDAIEVNQRTILELLRQLHGIKKEVREAGTGSPAIATKQTADDA
jgi:hypothetical protein